MTDGPTVCVLCLSVCVCVRVCVYVFVNWILLLRVPGSGRRTLQMLLVE